MARRKKNELTDSEPVVKGSESIEEAKDKPEENSSKKPIIVKNISRFKTFEVLGIPIKKGEIITLTDEQENDENFMAIVNRAIEFKMLAKV